MTTDRGMPSSPVRPWPDVAIAPGETLAETLEALGMSQAELARRTARPVQAINEIVHGKKAITAATALALEQALGVPAHVWMHLEADYRLTAARVARDRGGGHARHAIRRDVLNAPVRSGTQHGRRTAATNTRPINRRRTR